MLAKLDQGCSEDIRNYKYPHKIALIFAVFLANRCLKRGILLAVWQAIGSTVFGGVYCISSVLPEHQTKLFFLLVMPWKSLQEIPFKYFLNTYYIEKADHYWPAFSYWLNVFYEPMNICLISCSAATVIDTIWSWLLQQKKTVPTMHWPLIMKLWGRSRNRPSSLQTNIPL